MKPRLSDETKVQTEIKRLPDGSWITVVSERENKSTLKVLEPGEFIKHYNDRSIKVSSFSEDMFHMEDKVYFRDDSGNNADELGMKKADSVPFGIYNVELFKRFVRLVPKTINQDEYVHLDDQTANEIYIDIDKFIESGERYKKAGLLKKRGILLFGPPGNGKTMIISNVIEKYKDQARILFVSNSNILEDGYIEEWKDHFAKDLTIFMIEELTQYCGMGSDVTPIFLSFLDGQSSWDNCLIIATTNYPERLPGNLVDRPSRFDRIIRVDAPTPPMRQKYLEKMLEKGNVTEEMIKKTEGYSIAYLKEICVQMMVHGKGFDDILKESQARKDDIKNFFCETKPGNNSPYS